MLQPRSFGITYPYTPADEELLGQFVEPFPESKPDFITDFRNSLETVLKVTQPDSNGLQGSETRRSCVAA